MVLDQTLLERRNLRSETSHRFDVGDAVLQSVEGLGDLVEEEVNLAVFLGLGPDGTPANVNITITSDTQGELFNTDSSGLPIGGVFIPGAAVGDRLTLTYLAILDSTFAGERLGGFLGFSESQDWILSSN